MPIPYVDAIDLNKNEIQNARVHNNAGAPSSPAVGQIYFETTGGVNRLYVWNGTAFVLRATDSDALGGQTLAQVRDFSLTTGVRDHNAISDFDTQVRLSRLDQMANPTAAVNLNGQKLTNVGNATAATDGVNLGQLQAVQQGVAAKQEVRVASTGNVAVTYSATGGTSGRGQITAAPNTLAAIDPGTAGNLAVGDRILLKNQSTGAQDGIWVVTTVGTGANGVWDRAVDWDADADVAQGAFVFVQEGANNADSGWQLTTDNPIVVGGSSGTALTFAQFSGAGQITAGAGLTKTGNVLDVGQSTGIVVNADNIQIDTALVGRKAIFTIGDGVAVSYACVHSLNNQWVQVEVWEATGLLRRVDAEIRATDANTVTIYFTAAPASNAYKVIVVG